MAHLEVVGTSTLVAGIAVNGAQAGGTDSVPPPVPDSSSPDGRIISLSPTTLPDAGPESDWTDYIQNTPDTSNHNVSIYHVELHAGLTYAPDDPKQPGSFALDMSTPGDVTLEVVADPGESAGQPVSLVLETSESDSFNGPTLTGATGTFEARLDGKDIPNGGSSFDPTQNQFSLGAGTAISTTIGATFQVGFAAHLDGTMPGEGTLVSTAGIFATISAPTASATPTDLSFDPETGSVDYAYTIDGGDLPQPPQITFAWASDTTADSVLAAIPGTISGQTAQSDTPYTGTRPGSDFPAPPARTKYLLMEVEDDQGTHVISVPYAPHITVSDRYGAGMGEKAGVLGRFFEGVPVVGERLTVGLSPELAVLDHQASGLGVKLGGRVLHVSPTSTPGEFVTQTFDPGQLKGSTPLTVTDPRGGPGLAPIDDTVDAIPLPKWFAALNHVGEEFDPSTKSYDFSGSLVSLKTSAFAGFSLPAVPGLWLGAGLHSGVDLHANVTIVAPLDPGAGPTTETLQSGGSLTLLGSPVGPSLPNKTTPLRLNPRTLELAAFTYAYQTSGKASVSLLKGKSFNQPPLKIQPSLTASATYTVGLDITLNPDGSLDGTKSSLAFGANAAFTGDLLIPEFTLGSSALDGAIGRLKTLIANSNPASAIISELTSYLADALKEAGLLPSFSGSAKATGSVVLNGKVSLKGLPFTAQPTHGSLTGAVTLNAPVANLKFAFGGKSYDAASANLGGLLNLRVPIKKTF